MLYQYRFPALLAALSVLMLLATPGLAPADDEAGGLGEAAEEAKESAAVAAEGAGEAAQGAAEALPETIEDTAVDAEDAASEVIEAAEDAAKDALDTAEDVAKEATEVADDAAGAEVADVAKEAATPQKVFERPVGGGEATIGVPGDFATITEAIEAAEWGDTILVGPGVYQESIVFSETKGDGIILKSTNGASETSIAYGAEASVNEAVITFQRCSNSTQLIGFTIDGRDTAKRGILVNSQSRPVLHDLLISNSDYGVASHRSSNPYIQNTTIQKTSIAGLFVQGGGANVKDSRFIAGEKFGVYIRGTIDPVKMRNVRITDNQQVGIQATDGEFSLIGATIANNGDTGIILQDVSPLIQTVTVENHPNVGIVMEGSSGRVVNCTIKNNNFGVVCSIEGEASIEGCTFVDNPSYHVGVEGAAAPSIGGSQAKANQFLGETAYALQSSSSAEVIATHNYWDKPCVPKQIFQKTGTGKIKKKPWMSGNMLRVFDDCAESRKYNKKWKNGKLDDQGNPIGDQASAGEGSSDAG